MKINGSSSGSVTLAAPASGSDVTLTLPTTGFGKILQVVSTTKTDTFTASLALGSSTAITGLTATITPSSINSKVLCFAKIEVAGPGGNEKGIGVTLTRAATNIALGDTAGSRTSVTSTRWFNGDIGALAPAIINYLDSPNTTSATTYGVNIFHLGNNVTYSVFVNYAENDANSARFPRATSTITLMEVAP